MLRLKISADDAWEGLNSSEIEHFLDLHLDGMTSGPDERWPLAYTAVFVLGTSVALWSAIIFGFSLIL